MNKPAENSFNAKIYAWNTGRKYSEAGQRMAAVMLPSTGRVAFVDADRVWMGSRKKR